jgi:hypothetical protein
MMMDALYLGTVVVFFALTWVVMKMCDVLQSDRSGDNS